MKEFSTKVFAAVLMVLFLSSTSFAEGAFTFDFTDLVIAADNEAQMGAVTEESFDTSVEGKNNSPCQWTLEIQLKRAGATLAQDVEVKPNVRPKQAVAALVAKINEQGSKVVHLVVSTENGEIESMLIPGLEEKNIPNFEIEIKKVCI